jgi:hypothetical protein
MREVVRRVLQILLAAKFGLWLSLVERLPRVQEAVGSNPTSPTKKALTKGQILPFTRFCRWKVPGSLHSL